MKRTTKDLVVLLDRDSSGILQLLRRAMVESAMGIGTKSRYLGRDQMSHIVKNFSPRNPKHEYVSEYEQEDYLPKVARLMAIYYEAAERAIESGFVEIDDMGSKAAVSSLTNWQIDLRAHPPATATADKLPSLSMCVC